MRLDVRQFTSGGRRHPPATTAPISVDETAGVVAGTVPRTVTAPGPVASPVVTTPQVAVPAPVPTMATVDAPTPAETAHCGQFGPLPALPDSMNTMLVDLDGGGLPDDGVIAYPTEEGWRLRAVLYTGVVSETTITDEHDFVVQFATVVGPLHLFDADADHVMVQIREGGLNDHRLFAVDGSCIRAYTTSDAEFPALPVADGDQMKFGFRCEVRDGVPWIHGMNALRIGDGWEVFDSTFVSPEPFVLDWAGPETNGSIDQVVDGDPLLGAVAEADCDRLVI